MLGFTGTRQGMTKQQLTKVRELLLRYNTREAAHGGCIGADKQFHDLCLELDIDIDVYPSNLSKFRADCPHARITFDPKEPLKRNKTIVNRVSFVLAAPSKPYEILRSGTWATIRYARRNRKPVDLVLPSGQLLHSY